MRSKRMLRMPRPGRMAAGALLMTIPASAVALAAGQADAQSALQIRLSSHHVRLGQTVTITGTAGGAGSGRWLTLEFAPTGHPWRVLGRTKTHGDHFRFVVSLRETGRLRALASSASTAAGRLPAADPTPAPSAPQRVTVSSAWLVGAPAFNVLAGQSVHVYGRLLPAQGGRRIALIIRTSRGWTALARTRTSRNGGFNLYYTPGATGQWWMRVAFTGDGRNTPSSSPAGELTAYRQSVASWYDDGGATACGFHAYYGVANKSLPCGTQVTFNYNGRTVTATVDDRGPYVGGREWDLNQNTAGALGFGGVDTVWSTQ